MSACRRRVRERKHTGEAEREGEKDVSVLYEQ